MVGKLRSQGNDFLATDTFPEGYESRKFIIIDYFGYFPSFVVFRKTEKYIN